MTWDRSLYPGNWEEIALSVKEDASWHCEECGRPCRQPGIEWMAFVMTLLESGGPDGWYEQTCDEEADGDLVERPQRFTLTVAHLDHNPANCNRANLKALCSVCHLEYDNSTSSRFRKRQVKAERTGQLNLLEKIA